MTKNVKTYEFIKEMNSYHEFLPTDGIKGLVEQFKTFNDGLITKLSEIKNEIDTNVLITEIIDSIETINNSCNKWSSNRPKTYLTILKWIINNMPSEINITEKFIDLIIEESYKIGSQTIATFVKNRPEVIYMYENKLIKNKMSIKMADVLLDEKLSNLEFINHSTIIMDSLLNNRNYNYIDNDVIKYILDKINYQFRKEDIRKLVYNNQHSVIEYLIGNNISIDFGPYTEEDIKTITNNGFWRHYIFYNHIIENAEEVIKLAIRTSYLNASDVQLCIDKKCKINWNEIVLEIIEKRTIRQFKFFKEIIKEKLVVQDVNLTKYAILKYKIQVARELIKLGWYPKLTTDEFDTWLFGTKGKLEKSTPILEMIIKHNMYPVEEILNKIPELNYNIKWLKNPLQCSIWKFLKKLNIKIETSDLTPIIKYLKLNHKNVNESLFEYLLTLLGKDSHINWMRLFKLAGRNGNDNFMDLIANNISNYYETLELYPEIYTFCKTCSVETLKKFTNYQTEIKSELQKNVIVQKAVEKIEFDTHDTIDHKIESLKHQLRELKKIKKMKDDIKKKTY